MGKRLDRSAANRRPTSQNAKLEQGEPVWDIARCFPEQGEWSEAEYLALNGNKLVEFTDGFIEVLPTPTTAHQRIVVFLFRMLAGFAKPGGLGEALVARLRVRLWKRTFRGPDVVFMLAANAARAGDEYWDRPYLIMEVVSDGTDNRHRDLVNKRADYDKAKIPGYWIVDRRMRQITVLKLRGSRYAEHGVFAEGKRATSALLKGFSVEVDEVLAAAHPK